MNRQRNNAMDRDDFLSWLDGFLEGSSITYKELCNHVSQMDNTPSPEFWCVDCHCYQAPAIDDPTRCEFCYARWRDGEV